MGSRARGALLAAVMFATAAGPAGAETSPDAAATGAADAPAAGHCAPQAWAGTWFSDYGPVRLVVTGSTIAGTYGYTGRLRGRLDASGCLLDGTWDQGPTHAPPDDAGPFEFTLAPDGSGWQGSWSYEGVVVWDAWNGSRTPAPEQP